MSNCFSRRRPSCACSSSRSSSFRNSDASLADAALSVASSRVSLLFSYRRRRSAAALEESPLPAPPGVPGVVVGSVIVVPSFLSLEDSTNFLEALATASSIQNGVAGREGTLTLSPVGSYASSSRGSFLAQEPQMHRFLSTTTPHCGGQKQ